MFKWIRKVWDAIPNGASSFNLRAIPPPKRPPYPITEKCEIPPDMVGDYKEGTSTCINKRNQIEGWGIAVQNPVIPKKCCHHTPSVAVEYDDKGKSPGYVVRCHVCHRSLWMKTQAGAIQSWSYFTPDTVEKVKEECKSCRYFHTLFDKYGMCMGTVCRRRSEYRDRRSDHWCGEYERKDD